MQEIYGQLRNSAMNDWVGGADPEVVGEACHAILSRHLQLVPQARLLDFGCGIGRVTLAVLKHQPALAGIVGLDIMPQVVAFCRDVIGQNFPQACFDTIDDSNDHYDDFVRSAAGAARLPRDEVLRRYSASFSDAFSFSVFTHLEPADFAESLRLVHHLLQPGARFLFTCFLLTPATRAAIAANRCLFEFRTTAFEQDGDVFIGNPADRLGFIAFEQNFVERMVQEAGFVLARTERGSWSGCESLWSLQDVVVCQKPVPRSADIARPPTVDRSRLLGVGS